MAGSVNKAIIIGNLAADPVARSFQNGGKVVSLRVATSERWTDKASGEKKERSEFHNVSILNENLAKVAEQYLKKGSKVYIEGQLETRKWTDKQGVEKYSTEIVLRPYKGELTLLDGRGDTGGDTTTQNTQGASSGQSRGAGGGYSYDGHNYADLEDSSIPF